MYFVMSLRISLFRVYGFVSLFSYVSSYVCLYVSFVLYCVSSLFVIPLFIEFVVYVFVSPLLTFCICLVMSLFFLCSFMYVCISFVRYFSL